MILAFGLTLACTPDPQPAPRSAGASAHLTGTLQEQLDVAPYSYLRLATSTGEAWVAVPITRLDEQARLRPLTIVGGVAVKDVQVGTTGRRLATVLFGNLDSGDASRPR
jgi:hypothetical protein